MPNLNDIMEMMDALETKAIITIPTFCVAVRNRHSSCRKCVDACLADAITIEKGKDHPTCSAYLRSIPERFHPRYGCGKCQVAVPCERTAPGRRVGNRQ